MKPLYVSIGNTKLKKFKGISFDIPARKTCPKAGECAKVCYAVKLARIYKGYAAKVQSNLAFTRSSHFVDEISKEIEAFADGYFRIHGGGDFYSQEYLDKWEQVMRRFPGIQFYAYTKSLHLTFPKLKNFRVIKSRGGKLDNLIKSWDYQSKIVEKNAELPRGWVDGSVDDLWWLKGKRCILRKH
jgi:hypothetical protein